VRLCRFHAGDVPVDREPSDELSLGTLSPLRRERVSARGRAIAYRTQMCCGATIIAE